MAGACGPTAQRAGNALWGSCARDRLAPARRRPMAGAAARRAALAHRIRLVSQMAGAGAVRPLAGRCGPPPPPRDGPPGQASPEHHRHAVGQVHPGARATWVRCPKKVLGRKRVALVDADGTWLAVAVVPASVQDRDTLEALDPGKAAWPSLREAILDGAFTAASCHEWSNRHGMRHRVVERDPAQKGFVVLAGRWVVERSFGWLVHWGGLLRDRAGRLDVSAARIAFAAVLSGVEALLNPMPVQDAAS